MAGQAGENKVRFAAVMNDLYRAAARTGLGAVFGSKQLKAVVVKGNEAVPIATPHRFRTVTQKCGKDLTHTELGTTAIIRRMGEGGYLG